MKWVISTVESIKLVEAGQYHWVFPLSSKARCGESLKPKDWAASSTGIFYRYFAEFIHFHSCIGSWDDCLQSRSFSNKIDVANIPHSYQKYHVTLKVHFDISRSSQRHLNKVLSFTRWWTKLCQQRKFKTAGCQLRCPRYQCSHYFRSRLNFNSGFPWVFRQQSIFALSTLRMPSSASSSTPATSAATFSFAFSYIDS